MSSWMPEDPKVLEYEINECTVREFCDVFAMDLALAHNLEEYRSEVLHIFKLEQLLKLKGISEETLHQWQDPKANDAFDKELQHMLNLQTESSEPLPKLLEAACQSMEASAFLIAARKGTLLLKFTAKDSFCEDAACKLPNFIRPIHDSLLQMKQGHSDMQVMSFEFGDLLFQPTSGFYLVAVQPNEKLGSASLKMWSALAAEIRRRYPPKIYIERHAAVTENDIAFDCPQCHLRIVVDRAGIGCDVPCPRCKTQVTVPSETTSFSSYLTPEQRAATAA